MKQSKPEIKLPPTHLPNNVIVRRTALFGFWKAISSLRPLCFCRLCDLEIASGYFHVTIDGDFKQILSASFRMFLNLVKAAKKFPSFVNVSLRTNFFLIFENYVFSYTPMP